MNFIYHTRVYTDDTDYGGIVYHANYLKFMERARTEWLDHWGLPLSTLSNQGYFFVIRAAELNYLKPARLNDHLEITSEITDHTQTQFHFSHTVRNAHNKDCVYTTGEIKLVCVNPEFKPTRIPETLIQKITENKKHGH